MCVLYIVGAYKMQKCDIFANNSSRDRFRAKLYWTKETIPDGDPNPEEQMKGTRNDKKKKEANVTNTINICLFSILFLVSLKYLKDIKL